MGFKLPVSVLVVVHTVQLEVLLLERLDGARFTALVRPGRRLPSGARVTVDGVARGISPVMVTELSAGEHAVVLESDLGSTTQTVTKTEMPLNPQEPSGPAPFDEKRDPDLGEFERVLPCASCRRPFLLKVSALVCR